jgi:hypothetical protein
MQLSSSQLTFLARFAKTPDGRAMFELLKAKLAEREASLRKQTGEEIYRCQGRALELDELLADITEAGTRLTRSQQRPTRIVGYEQSIPG